MGEFCGAFILSSSGVYADRSRCTAASFRWRRHPGFFFVLAFLLVFIRVAEGYIDQIRSDYSDDDVEEEKPEFVRGGQNITATRGRDVKIPCIIDNLGEYKTAWIRVEDKAILTIQQQVISRDPRIYISSSDNRHFVLGIRGVQEADHGGYMCQINTSPMMSQTTFVDVMVPPDIIVEESSSDMVVQERSNVTLRCRAKGRPKPDISWRREDNEPLPSQRHRAHKSITLTNVSVSGKFHKGSSHIGEELHLINVGREHMGAYLCIANNNIPSPVSRRIMVHVHFAPIITLPNEGWVRGSLDGNITLQCQLESYPHGSVQWFKDGVVVSNGTVLSSTSRLQASATRTGTSKVSATLHISRIRKSDFGAYRCVAENLLGMAEGQLELKEVKPEVELQKSDASLGDHSYVPPEQIITKEFDTRPNGTACNTWQQSHLQLWMVTMIVQCLRYFQSH